MQFHLVNYFVDSHYYPALFSNLIKMHQGPITFYSPFFEHKLNVHPLAHLILSAPCLTFDFGSFHFVITPSNTHTVYLLQLVHAALTSSHVDQFFTVYAQRSLWFM